MNFLTLKFFISRSKTLLKRRKKKIKNPLVAKKFLKQNSLKDNATRAYKALQIHKQLDRKSHPSTHINELMDEIFYPDVKYAHENAAQANIKVQCLSQRVMNEEEEDMEEIDEIREEILKKNLATELLELYEKMKAELTFEHIELILSRIKSYFKNRDVIKQRYERKWNHTVAKMKKQDFKYQPKKCPFLFLEKTDIHKYQLWNNLINDLVQTSKMCPVETIFMQMNYCSLICDAIEMVPFQLYDKVLEKLLTINIEEMEDFQIEEKVKVVRFINLKFFVKYPSEIVIQEAEKIKVKEDRISIIGKRLCFLVMKDENCQFKEMKSILRPVMFRQRFLTLETLEAAQSVILKNLEHLSFESIFDIFLIYLRSKFQGKEVLEIMKFDIYRKIGAFKNEKYLFKLLSHYKLIKKTFPSNDLLTKTVYTITSRFMGKNVLEYGQISQLIDVYYENNINDSIFLQLVTNQFIKNSEKFTLEELTEMSFKIFILGYRSSAMAEFLFQQFLSKYETSIKRHRQNAKLLLPAEEEVPNKGKSSQEIYLQECLVICLWMFLNTTGKTIPTEKIIQIYPLRLETQHPLPIQMSKSIYKYLEKEKMFGRIKHSPVPSAEKDHRLNIYYGRDHYSSIQRILQKEAVKSGKFVLNYHLQKQFFLRELWSNVNCFETYNYASWLEEEESTQLYFDQNKTADENLLSQRQKLKEEMREEKSKNNKEEVKEKTITYYDL